MNAMTTRKSSSGKVAAFFAAVATGMSIPTAALAASSISVDSVTQRWPWNNKVDITYTVTDGANHEGGVYAGVEFTITVPGRGSFTVPGPTAETGGTGSRQHTFAWSAPSGIKATDCTVTATLFPTNTPSDDYMVIDLATGAVAYERLLATQVDSNFRYNTPEYKTTKMVLRKIPKWADRATLPNASDLSSDGYPTGYDGIVMSGNRAYVGQNVANLNNRAWRQPDKSYYIGIFDVTESQYNLVTGVSSPGTSFAPFQTRYQTFRTNTSVDLVNLSNDDYSKTERIALLTNAVAAVASDTGSFLQRLNYRTGLYFDFPTEVMHEIAARAGTTTVYIWGDTTDGYEDYVSCNAGDNLVGTKAANAWGLYDMCGLGYDWCLGAAAEDRFYNSGDYGMPRLHTQGVFAPSICKSTGVFKVEPVKGGGSYSEDITSAKYIGEAFRASNRNYQLDSGTACCRVSCIVQ